MANSLSSLSVSADALSSLTSSAARLGTVLDQAFAKAAAQGKNFDTTLKAVEKSLVALIEKSARNQLDQSFSSLFGSATQQQSASASSSLIPFASGGIVTTPTQFGVSGTRGLAGEAGAEAIMPLSRGPDGKLGLRGGAATNVNITIQAQDVDSFRRSEAQIAAQMTRALQRGRRAM